MRLPCACRKTVLCGSFVDNQPGGAANQPGGAANQPGRAVSTRTAARISVQPAEAPGLTADYRAMSGTSFRFRLERVRALRERSEDAAKQALAEAMQGHDVAAEALQRAQAQVAAAQAAQSAATTGPQSVTDLMAHQAFLERSERAVVASHQDLSRHEHHLEQRREQLTEAARERQALERLKENRRADHDRELARREALDLDEIAITGFRRRAA